MALALESEELMLLERRLRRHIRFKVRQLQEKRGGGGARKSPTILPPPPLRTVRGETLKTAKRRTTMRIKKRTHPGGNGG
jgi:hypothetical protein